jgi:hypothetical protein
MHPRNICLKAPAPIPQISAGADPQTHSPLLSTLPGEIRTKIYAFTLTSSDDPSKPFSPQHHHYRPGHTHRQRYDVSILQTCKRIYHEARLLPASLNKITIYLYRGPRSNLPLYSQYDWRERYGILNADQRDAVQTMHFFAQQFYLEGTPDLLRPGGFLLGREERRSRGDVETDQMTARTLVLTFRRSDWWSWESPIMSNDQLGICPWRRGRTDWKQMEGEPLEGPKGEWEGWGGQFQYVRELETLEIEFESVATKKAQLERVVERAKHWKFPLKDGKVLIWAGGVKEWTWEGSLKLQEDNGDRAVQLKSIRSQPVDAKPATCTCVVMMMRWRVSKREEADRETNEPGGLASGKVLNFLSPEMTEAEQLLSELSLE